MTSFDSTDCYLPLLTASLLKTALEGLSADTAIINEIFCLSSHQELTLILDSFTRKYNLNIRDRLQSKLTGKNHTLLLTKLIQSGRVEDQSIDMTLAIQQAASFNTILDKTTLLGGLTEEATVELLDLMLTLSYSQAQVVKAQFEIQNLNRPSLESLISQRIGGGLQEALLLLLSIPNAVYARKIMEACTGGSEEAIWRIIGGHNVDAVSAIAEEYTKNFNTDMRTVREIFLQDSPPTGRLTCPCHSSFAREQLEISEKPWCLILSTVHIRRIPLQKAFWFRIFLTSLLLWNHFSFFLLHRISSSLWMSSL